MKLEELRKICDAATPGPWRFAQLLDGIEARALLDSRGYLFGRSDDLQNGEFIEAARTYMPMLLDLFAMAKSLVLDCEKTVWGIHYPCQKCDLEKIIKAIEEAE